MYLPLLGQESVFELEITDSRFVLATESTCRQTPLIKLRQVHTQKLYSSELVYHEHLFSSEKHFKKGSQRTH